MSAEKKVISIASVVAMFDEGKTRTEIKQSLGLTHAEMSMVFKNPALKNRRQAKALNLEIVDDYIAPEVPIKVKKSKGEATATSDTSQVSSEIPQSPIPPQANTTDTTVEEVNAEEEKPEGNW